MRPSYKEEGDTDQVILNPPSFLNILKDKIFFVPENIKRVFVLGDIHGDLNSFNKAIKYFKSNINNSILIFLGDYEDIGEYGVEIIETLSDLLDKDKRIIALKGNHEDYDANGIPRHSKSDLIKEVEKKRGKWKEWFENIMKPFINKLYLAALWKGVALFVHGGISRSLLFEVNPRRLEKIILWSDPFEGTGEMFNDLRGAGVLFGEDVTIEVLNSMGVKLLIRSHQPFKAKSGIFIEHNGRVITVNSSVYYGKPVMLSLNNKAEFDVIELK